ncbi:MAG: efflux RND transporter periplasmic adaptor subunit [Anaerolineales bacterium]
MFKKSFILSISLALAVVLLLSACGSATQEPAAVNGVGEVTSVDIVTTVEATGSITALRLASVNWKTSGTIQEINVKVGQQVKAGDILMSLDPNSVPDSLISSMQNLAEMTSPRAIATAQKAVVDASTNLDDMQQERDYLNGGYSQGQIDNAYAEMVLAKGNLDKAQESYNQVKDRPEGDSLRASAYTRLFDAQTAYNSKKRVYDTYSSYSASADDIALADANLALAKAQLEEAQNYLAALTGGEVPEGATGSSLQQLYQAQRTVDQLNLRAPFDGTVGAIYNQTYDVVSANTASVLVLNRSNLYVTVPVEEVKVVQLSIGDKATITLDALPDLTGLTGKVVSIDPVGTASQGVVYYNVMVELEQNDPRIILDATANVTIQAGDASQMLAVPVTAVQNDTDGEYVLVYNNDGSTRRVNVVSGQIQPDDTVVVSGDLKVGDQVVLVQSSSDTQGGPGGMFRP